MKMISEKQLGTVERIAFNAGMTYALRRLLETNTIIYGPSGYGSALKTVVDLGKQDEIDAVAFELLNGTALEGRETSLV